MTDRRTIETLRSSTAPTCTPWPPGSSARAAEADDALQEAWIRVSRADAREVENLGGWLTTVVSRVCLTMLDARRRRREEELDAGRLPDPVVTRADERAPDPESEALAADAVGAALLVVLEQLAPAERLAFVLHDIFALPFDGHRARRRPHAGRGAPARQPRAAPRPRRRPPDAPAADRAVVDAFLAAARGGDFEGLLAVLDPDVVLRTDDGGGALQIVEGARAVAGNARFFAQRRVAHPATVDGAAGLRRHRGRRARRGAALHGRRGPDHRHRRARRAGPRRRAGLRRARPRSGDGGRNEPAVKLAQWPAARPPSTWTVSPVTNAARSR